MNKEDRKKKNVKKNAEEIALFLNDLVISDDKRIEISKELQRSENWAVYRECRLTASDFGAAAGHNPYCSPYELLNRKLWGGFKGNEKTDYGTFMEDTARDMAEVHFTKEYGKLGYTRIWIEETGLYIPAKYPWLGASADGILHVRGGEGAGLPDLIFLVEIKCPYSRNFYPTIPHYYYDQIQGCMALLGLKCCKFIVYIPEEIQISTFPFDENYWDTILFPELESWYMNKFIKRKNLQRKGILQTGQIDIIPVINL